MSDTVTKQIATLNRALKAAEDKMDEMEHDRSNEREEVLKSILAGLSSTARKAVMASLRGQDDEDSQLKKKLLESMSHEDDGEDEELEGSSDEDEEEDETYSNKLSAKVRSLTARINKYEQREAKTLISDLVSLKASLVPDLDEDKYRRALAAKSYSQLERMHKERKDELVSLKAAKENRGVDSGAIHMPFLAREGSGYGSSEMTKMSSIMTDSGGIF